MNNISKIFLTAVIWIFFLWNIWSIYAADSSVSLIPNSQDELSGEKCNWLFYAFWANKWTEKKPDYSSSWEFNFDMIWCYIIYLIDVFSKMAVMISFVFVLIWAFRYTITYLEWDDDWKKAKETIKNALLWLAVSTLAYVIVDIFIRFLL